MAVAAKDSILIIHSKRIFLLDLKAMLMTMNISLGDEIIMNKIHLIRDKKVMLDTVLPEFYGVETKQHKGAEPVGSICFGTRTKLNQILTLHVPAHIK